ncbi:hypothetical protein [Ruminococcus albus]|uniref:Uncharacterized protein n=1 Tax=Ruminococcus albus 8 TaxID=246199 RepID=E9SA73_RUMAL|nr:hypothetical protein [Ruminococcus albus]EGC03862.1 hypothetical protein CUS_6524 [Ruminococcus albus 8]MCC3350449.1 hypothetical protein [Ruminococcus albus 8]
MELLIAGIILLLIQLPLGWTAGYILKAMGFALCAAGFAALTDFCGQQNKNDKNDPPDRASGLGGIAVWRVVRDMLQAAPESAHFCKSRLAALGMLHRNAVISAGAALVSAGAAAVFEFLVKSPAGAYAAAFLGAVNTFTSLRVILAAVGFLCENDSPSPEKRSELHFTDNRTDLLRLKDILGKTAICMLVNLACDLLNRIIPIESVQTFAGFMAAMSKLTLYVFAIAAAVRANAVREGFYRKHPEAKKERDSI